MVHCEDIINVLKFFCLSLCILQMRFESSKGCLFFRFKKPRAGYLLCSAINIRWRYHEWIIFIRCHKRISPSSSQFVSLEMATSYILPS